MAFRDDIRALSDRHDALDAETSAKVRERDEARRMLDEARTRAKLPVLDNIRVASPCRADWNQMVGDERARHCGDCKKSVYNISEMTRDEAQALIIEKEGELCVRYFQRHDGTILLADCTIGVKQKRRRRLVVAGATVLLAAGALVAFRKTKESTVMGGMHAEPPLEHLMGGSAFVPPEHREMKGELQVEAPPKRSSGYVMGNK